MFLAYLIVIFTFLISCSDDPTGNDEKNHAPEIINLVSDPDTIATGATSVLTCNANDLDDDELTFVWESDYGSVNG